MSDAPERSEAVGYRRPPASSRFRKGQSGNPRGRPRGRRNEPPYEAVLGQMVTIREDGVERRVTAAEAFLLHVTKKGLEGDGAAARAAMAAIEEARASRLEREPEAVHRHRDQGHRPPGSVNGALEPLRMGRKLDRYRETARMMLEPWIVEAALARLGDRRLTLAEQQVVRRRDPHAGEGALAGLVGGRAMRSLWMRRAEVPSQTWHAQCNQAETYPPMKQRVTRFRRLARS